MTLNETPCVRRAEAGTGSERAPSTHEQQTILQPGRNRWRIRPALRASVLIDGADYFARLDTVLRQARRSVFIIGWDFDAGIRLRPEMGGPTLGELLRTRVEAEPELELRILVWDLSTLHAPGEALPLIIGAKWQEHPRIQLWLDHNHPIYGAQHQKIVCVDDRIAFVGGIDLTAQRWDTSEHLNHDPRRTGRDGDIYRPVHDTQVILEGDAALAVAELVRHRWRHAVKEEPPPVAQHDGELWPQDLEPDFAEVPVAISRTIPASGNESAVQEIFALTSDALRSAKRAIYIEAQYLADARVGDILISHLKREDGPEIVIVAACQTRGFLERWTMGNNRDRLIRRLKRADRHGRLMISYPAARTAEGDREIFVHSKLMIVDGRFLRIGSGNLNRRSTGLDTECDVAIEATNGAERERIEHVRARLISEHLGVAPETFAEAEREERSLIRAIRRLNTNGHHLQPFDHIRLQGPTHLMPGTRLLDPRKPFRLISLFRKRRPAKRQGARA